MKLFILLISFLTLTAHARISLFDLVQEGRGTEFGIKAECLEQLQKVSRESLLHSELQPWIKPLHQITARNEFFHYTNADIFLDIFEVDERDRNYVQTLITKEKRLDAIMHHSYKSTGINIAGTGFYLATDPFSSRKYGSIQLRVSLKSNARVLFDPSNTSVKNYLQRTLRKNNLESCENSDVIKSLFLQENGVDAVWYERREDWLLLINEDIIVDTDILNPVYSLSEVYKELMKANRLKEAMNSSVGAGELEFTSRIHYIGRCDSDAKVETNCAWTKDEFELFLTELIKIEDENSLKRFVSFYLYFDLKDMNHFASQLVKVRDEKIQKIMAKESCYSTDQRRKERVYLIDELILKADHKYERELKRLKKENCR